jgi:hypothetical protein
MYAVFINVEFNIQRSCALLLDTKQQLPSSPLCEQAAIYLNPMAQASGIDESAFEWVAAAAPGGRKRVVRAGWSRAAPSASASSASGAVGVLVLSRATKRNAWNAEMWEDWNAAVAALAARDTIRAVRRPLGAAWEWAPPQHTRVCSHAPSPWSPRAQVVLAADGPTFTGGLDLASLAELFAAHQGGPGACPARQRVRFGGSIRAMQEAYTLLERQPWPIIAAVQGEG